MITIYRHRSDTKAPHHRDIKVALDRVRNSQYKDLIKEIRDTPEKERRNELKSQLPAILFAGEFSDRNDKSIQSHSGFICLDFDGFKDEEMDTWRDTLHGDQYTYACFLSPSGNGYKVITRIPAEIHNHRLYFATLKEKWSVSNFDDSSVNISRICYESYDPNLYINEDASVWSALPQREIVERQQGDAYIPIKEEHEIISRLMVWWEKNYGFNANERHTNLIKLAFAFNRYGLPQSTALTYMMQYQTDDFPLKEIQGIVRGGYKNTGDFGSSYFEDTKRKHAIKTQVVLGKDPAAVRKELEVDGVEDAAIDNILDEANDEISAGIFWTVGQRGNITVTPIRFKRWLQDQGFAKYYLDNTTEPTFIKITNRKVREVSVSKIKDFVLEILESRDQLEVFDHLASKVNYFTEKYLSMLETVDLNIMRDGEKNAFFFFENGVIEITKTTHRMIDYIDIDGYVWESQIMPRDFKLVDDASNDFAQVVKNISQHDEHRINAMECTLGYLIHSFKDATESVAVIFNDQEISDEPDGGSGKSLVLDALGHFRSLVMIDAKGFDPEKSNFTYQRVQEGTQILAFDDIDPDMKFEKLFTLITGGIEVERKGKDAFFIPFSRSPKIVLTTNYVINGSGNSHERRRHEIEFFQHYNRKWRPKDEFKVRLFDGWDIDAWNRFDNYMIACTMAYLQQGLVAGKTINADSKRFISSTSEDFYYWTQDDNLSSNTDYGNNELREKYMKDNSIGMNEKFTGQRFMRWVSKYGAWKGWEYHKFRDGKEWKFRLIDKSAIKDITKEQQEHDEKELSDKDSQPF